MSVANCHRQRPAAVSDVAMRVLATALILFTVPDAGSAPLPATWISGRLLVGYGGFVENQIPRLNYKRYLMLTVEKGRITKREFQDRKLWDH